MQRLGLVATEFGPPGFLEADADSRVAQLAEYGLSAVGGFHVAVLHDPGHDPLPGVDAFIDECLAAKAGMVVLAAGTGQDGYDARPELDEAGWRTLLGNLDRIAEHAAGRGVEASLHPHMGTMIESGAGDPAGRRGLAHRPVRGHRAPDRRGCRSRRHRGREPGSGCATSTSRT